MSTQAPPETQVLVPYVVDPAANPAAYRHEIDAIVVDAQGHEIPAPQPPVVDPRVQAAARLAAQENAQDAFLTKNPGVFGRTR
jgi:hypothetical protein